MHWFESKSVYIPIFRAVRQSFPVTVAEGSKVCTIFPRSEAKIVCSNPTQGIDV
jgi:hypothetical protein